jgi:hypothetical protein
MSKTEDQESVDYTEPVLTYTSTPSTPHNHVTIKDPLSPWEKWMVQKAKELRIQHEKELEAIHKHKSLEQQKKVEERLKQDKADRARKEWMEKKSVEFKLKQKK